MKYTGRFTRVKKDGTISIPKHILRKVGISDKSTVEIYSIRNGISIQKKLLTCLVTGNVSEGVVEVLPGINLSEEGMHILLKVLKD